MNSSLDNKLKRLVMGTPSVCRFIEEFGTHIITGLSVGGQDVIYVKQDQSSALSPSELKLHLDNLGDQLFAGACILPPFYWKSKEHRNKVCISVCNSHELIPTTYI